jgi:hypothetical protein
MDVLGIALIVCGLALISGSLILQLFRSSEPATSEPATSVEAVKPFVPRPWVDPHPDEAPKERDESLGAASRGRSEDRERQRRRIR